VGGSCHVMSCHVMSSDVVQAVISLESVVGTSVDRRLQPLERSIGGGHLSRSIAMEAVYLIRTLVVGVVHAPLAVALDRAAILLSRAMIPGRRRVTVEGTDIPIHQRVVGGRESPCPY
jgi:hypothetical protein